MYNAHKYHLNYCHISILVLGSKVKMARVLGQNYFPLDFCPMSEWKGIYFSIVIDMKKTENFGPS